MPPDPFRDAYERCVKRLPDPAYCSEDMLRIIEPIHPLRDVDPFERMLPPYTEGVFYRWMREYHDPVGVDSHVIFGWADHEPPGWMRPWGCYPPQGKEMPSPKGE